MTSIEKDILIAQYQYLERQVNFSKQQQMRVTNYTLILYGAIITTHNQWYAPCANIRLLPYIISILIMVVGIYFMYSCEDSQKKNNVRVRKLRERFRISKEIIGSTDEKSVKVGYIYYLLHIFSFLITVSIITN